MVFLFPKLFFFKQNRDSEHEKLQLKDSEKPLTFQLTSIFVSDYRVQKSNKLIHLHTNQMVADLLIIKNKVSTKNQEDYLKNQKW